MESEIQKFYKNKTIFLTGGTGFLGKVFMERLLRETDVERIYLLIRPKSGKSIEKRIFDIFSDPLFEKVQKLKQDAVKRVKPMYGDCVLPKLGLSSPDRATLIEEVDIILHAAATVRFNEPLSNALAINVRGTVDLIELAKNMIKLKSLVHVSSAFANCIESKIDERFYADKLNTTAEKICQLADLVGPEILNRMSPDLLKEFPNTYTYTKALAEQAVLSQAQDLPVCVFRPGIIISSCKDPAGWIDNLYGPTSILYGVAYGILRVMYMRLESRAHVVPVDYCANAIIAAAWQTAKASHEKFSTSDTESAATPPPPSPPTIYNFTPDNENAMNWGNYKRVIEEHGFTMPLSRMIWVPFLIATDSKFLYKIFCFLYHTIPGYIFDFGLLLMGKRRRMSKTYTKIHKQTELLHYFVDNEWEFSIDNTKQLWKSLSPEDQQKFDFNMMNIHWSQYFYESLRGMRMYLSNEQPSTIPKGLRLLSRLLILHRVVQCLVYGGGSLLVLTTFSRLLRSF